MCYVIILIEWMSRFLCTFPPAPFHLVSHCNEYWFQSVGRDRLFATPWTASSMSGGFPVLHHLPELAQTHVHWVSDAIQLSCPLSSPSPAALSLSQHCRLSYPQSQWAFYFTPPLGRGKYPTNQCANFNLTDLRPERPKQAILLATDL